MNIFKQHGYPVSPGFSGNACWDIFISYIGFFESSGDFHWEQTSPMFCIHAIQKGTGIFRRNGKKYEVKAGETFTFFPGDHIVYYDFPETPWEYIWFRLDGKNVEAALSVSNITPKHPCRTIAKPGRLESYLHEISSIYADGKYHGLFPVTAACNCLELISGRDSDSKSFQPGGKTISESFISIVESQMNAAPSISEIAESMKINRSTLFRAFISEHGISPKRYLENLRLDKASWLLSDTKLNVKEIAEACGFSHPSHFGKVFQEHFGASPMEWRKRTSDR
ncbi:MAG: AraC family transcriptional regulator [Lentisphaerota bacterium]